MAEFTVKHRRPAPFTAASIIPAYQGLQLRDGRAALLEQDVDTAGIALPTVQHIYECTKESAINLLDGVEVWWDYGNNRATYKRADSKSFLLGTAVGDALAGATTVLVDFGVRPVHAAELGDGYWTAEAVDGLGVSVLPGGGVKLAFDNATEAAQAALISTVPISADQNPIVKFRMAVFDIGDNAALNINIGLASGSHATDFQTVSQFVAFRFKGSDLSIWGESDDGSTDVAAVDTTLNATDDTEFVCWIDCRDKSNCKLYVNGVRVLNGTTGAATTLTLAAYSGSLFLIIHMTKTSDDTTADVRLLEMAVQTSEQ